MGQGYNIEGLVPVASNVVKNSHKSPYSAISPRRPELSQRGRTVLITGASAGIGFAIARAFAEASAARIIMTGRRRAVLQDAALKLSEEFTDTKFDAQTCDVANVSETAALWDSLRTEGILVDVLVLNAAKFGSQDGILATDVSQIWSAYETNVRAVLDFTQRFHKQGTPEFKSPKFLVYVSTAAIHSREIAASLPTYAISKTAGQLLVQKLSHEVAPNEMQIISFHPGSILSETSRNAGLDEDSLPFDDIELPAHFAVWAATSEATFLHGRFVWAAWDVNEISSGTVRERIMKERDFLTVEFVGLK